MVLRKMQIPIKDIIRIYEREDMSTVVEVFVDRINAIDDETNALAELKKIVSDFLQTMIENAITKISDPDGFLCYIQTSGIVGQS